MQLLGLMFILAVLAANLWGVALAAGFYWRDRWMAIVLGPLLVVTAFYALECQHGLGPSLAGLGLVLTLVSGALIWLSASFWEPKGLSQRALGALHAWRGEFAPTRFGRVYAVFAGIFLYAFAWRFTTPDIDGSSEKIADFSYICSYLRGGTIPVTDAWFFPYASTQYYSFQHYGAALMGRLLALTPGETYNLAFCVLIALGGTAFAGAVAVAARRAWVRALLIAGFLVGGMGTTLFVHLTDRQVNPWTSMRYIGSAPMDKAPLGPIVKAYQSKFEHMELPGEPFSYSIYLGDYHAPLSGYYLLGLGAIAIGLWGRTRLGRYAFLAGGTLTWMLLANTWLLPLQAMGVVAWLVVSWRDWRILLPCAAAGAAAVWVLSWVYLSAFVDSAAGYDVALRMVPWREHTPPLLFLLFMLPTVALVTLGLASGTSNGRRLGLLWLVILLFSEYFFVDDVYSGVYDRFNTTLKWWPWIAAGSLMTLGPVVLEQTRRLWIKCAAVLFCLYPCCYMADLWTPLFGHHGDSVGHMEGTQYLVREQNPRLMLAQLKVEKPGVAIERPESQGGFTNSAVVPLFAGKGMWLGWYGHELLWRGFREDIRKRHDNLDKLYSGRMPNAGTWLLAQGIDYVLWYRAGDTPELWRKVNQSVSPEYVWCEVLSTPGASGDIPQVGLWRRAP